MVNEGSGQTSGSNDTQNWGRFGSNAYHSQNTLACPPGYYAYGVYGKSGADVNQLNGIRCRNIVTGATQDVTGTTLGSDGGGNGGGLWAGNNDGLAGFSVRAQNEVESIKTEYRGANPKSCCGGGTYSDGSRMGNNQQIGPYVCDGNHLVNSISGGTSNSKGYLTNFSWSCRNFNNMARIANNPLDCCIGADTSQDCQDVQSYLSCPAVVKSYCSTGDKIFTDPKCTAAIGAPTATNGLDPTTVANIKLKSCAAGTNYTTDACSDFCTAKTGEAIPIANTSTDALIAGSTIKDGCNALYTLKCSLDSSAAVCGCQRPWSSYPGYTDIPDKAMYVKDPACYFDACRNFGYFSKPLSEHGCPTCVQYQQLSASGSNIALQNIIQSCNTGSSTSGTTSPPVSLTTAPTTSSAPTPAASANSTAAPATSRPVGLIILLVAVVVMIVLIVVAVFL